MKMMNKLPLDKIPMKCIAGKNCIGYFITDENFYFKFYKNGKEYWQKMALRKVKLEKIISRIC